MNTFGRYFRVTTWGESHGPGIGAVVDGCPPGLPLSAADIQGELDLRKPGQGEFTSPRRESDQVEILSGVFEGRTLGTPISLVLWNRDPRPADYSRLEGVYRPGHADHTWQWKYGRRDTRGGGRSSGRETAGRVAAGASARKLLALRGVQVLALARRIGGVELREEELEELFRGAPAGLQELRGRIYASAVRCPHPRAEGAMQELLRQVSAEKDSLGGVVEARAYGLPPGLGEPVFHKLGARVGQAVLSIGAVKGVEFGLGVRLAGLRGSQANDPFVRGPQGEPVPASNNAGGLAGGISTGLPLVCRAAVKPTASIGRPQRTVDAGGREVDLVVEGRHDPCIVPRVVPVVEHMINLALGDLLLAQGALRSLGA